MFPEGRCFKHTTHLWIELKLFPGPESGRLPPWPCVIINLPRTTPSVPAVYEGTHNPSDGAGRNGVHANVMTSLGVRDR